MSNMNYNEAINYIHSINWSFCKPGLDRIRTLCRSIGDPQDSLKFVHVAGTNGKGSFCSMLDSVLRESGYKTGLFTSPYILRFNERIKYCGEDISDDELAEVTSYIKPFADAMDDKPTEFELITAIGFEYFKRKGCDIVILETGMGGRLDSTNIIKSPLLSVITGISLDHTAYLGNTIEEIAAEKAGIIKPSVPVLYGGTDSTALKIIAQKAKDCGSVLYSVQRQDIKNIEYSIDATTFDYKDRKEIRLSLLGSYQPYNAANVIEAVDALSSLGISVTNNAIYSGLNKAKWCARFEVISKSPLIIYDGAHNPEGINAACESVKLYFGDKKIAVLSGVMKDKDYTYIASKLSSIAKRAFTVTPDNPRALDAATYADTLLAAGIESTPHQILKNALQEAIDYSVSNNTPLLCLGSLYMYSELTEVYKSLI